MQPVGARTHAQAGGHDAADVLVPVVALGVIAALVLLRSHDDNALVSWSWVFARTNPLALFGVVASALAVAAVLTLRSPAALFVASFAMSACFWGEPEVIADASRYFAQAKSLEVHGAVYFLREWGREIPAWTDLPLVPLLYGLVFRYAGESRLYAQLLTSLFFAGTVVLTCAIGKRLFNQEAAGLFLLAVPYLFTQVPLLLVDVPAMFFFALAVYAATTSSLLFATVAIVLAALTKYSIWLLLPSVWIVQRRLRFGPVAVLLALIALRADVFAAQVTLLREYQAPGLARWGESLASTLFFQIHPFLTLAAIVGLLLAAQRREWTTLAIAWPVAALLAAGRARYFIPALPMLALLGARGLQAMRPQRLILAAAVSSSLAVALFGYLPFLRSTSAANLQAAGDYLDSLEAQPVEVFATAKGAINPAVYVPLLDLYTSQKLAWRPEPATAPQGVSSLRFTWDWRMPPLYAGPSRATVRVVISDRAGAPAPQRGWREARTFTADEGVFSEKTFVSVYLKQSGGGDT